MKFLLHHFALDEAGGIRIGQSRVTLDSLLAAYHSGSTPEEIAVQYSVLHLGEIYESVAYYLSHRQQIDSYLEQRHRKQEQQRSEFVQQYNLANLRQRLLDRFSYSKTSCVKEAREDGTVAYGLIRHYELRIILLLPSP